MAPTVRPLPATAGALLAGDRIFTHTSVRGDVAPRLHPTVQRVLDEVPADRRERFAGWCAEVVLVSDRLYAADEAAGRPLDATEARAELAGAQVIVTRVRERGDPTHGQPQPPCRSCAFLLDRLGVGVAT